jgi:hypothetical protein
LAQRVAGFLPPAKNLLRAEQSGIFICAKIRPTFVAQSM